MSGCVIVTGASAVERHGAIDVLINNAGAPALLRELDAMSWDDWRRNFDVDLRGVFNTTTRVAPLMRARGRGAIVNVASAGARHVDADGLVEWGLFAATPVAAREG